MPKLTKAYVEQSLRKDKSYFIWDDEIKGFGCEILKGGKKTYTFLYYSPVSKKKARIKIGCHGNITIDFARKKALELSLLVASGIDPRDQKKQEALEEKQSILFEEFFQIFKEKHMPTYKDGGRGNMSFMSCHLLPYFSGKPMANITSKNVREFLETKAHIKTTANRCFALLSVMFKKAEEWEYLLPKSNPCTDVSKYPERKRQRFLSKAEYERLVEALNEKERTSKEAYYTVNAIRFAIYIGFRKENVLTLKWEDVHLEERYIHLPDSKVGEDAQPLNDKAIALLSSLKRKTNNPYVFPGKVPGKHLVEIKTAWASILKRANIPDMVFHDLRHTFASYCLQGGLDLYTTSKLLGHKNIQTTTRYAHFELEHLKKATNQMAKIFG